MKKIISKLNIYFIFIGIVLGSIIILSLLNLIGLSKSITNIISICLMIITFIIMGFLKGKNSEKSGYLQGLKIGSLLVSILLILGTLTFDFNLKSFLYYIILILSAIFGAMIGINKKK